MAIDSTLLGFTEDNGSPSTIATASITPTNTQLIFTCVWNGDNDGAGTADEPTVAGCGATWDVIASIEVDAGSSGWRRVSVFRTTGTSSAGSVTATFDDAQTGAAIAVIEWNTDTSTAGTNGADAIVQSNSNTGLSGTSHNTGLNDFADATNNAAFLAVVTSRNTDPTADADLANIHVGNHTSQNTGWIAAFGVGEDLTPGCSWTSTGFPAGVSVEIAAAVAAAAGGHGHLLSDRRNTLVYA